MQRYCDKLHHMSCDDVEAHQIRDSLTYSRTAVGCWYTRNYKSCLISDKTVYGIKKIKFDEKVFISTTGVAFFASSSASVLDDSRALHTCVADQSVFAVARDTEQWSLNLGLSISLDFEWRSQLNLQAIAVLIMLLLDGLLMNMLLRSSTDTSTLSKIQELKEFCDHNPFRQYAIQWMKKVKHHILHRIMFFLTYHDLL